MELSLYSIILVTVWRNKMSTEPKANKKRTAVKKTSVKAKLKAKTKVKAKSVKAKTKSKAKKIASKSSKLKTSSAKMLKRASDGLKQVMNLAPALKDLEEKMLPQDFVKVLAKVEKTLEEFNTKVARKL